MMIKLKNIVHDLRWRWHRLRNPGATYGEFYSTFIAHKIENGERHPTLSAEPKSTDHYVKATQQRMEFLRDHGLQEGSKVLDYGCGGLRMGKALIPLLPSGCYLGMDITDKFYAPAAAAFDRQVMEEKKPSFAVISDDSLDRAKSFAADLVYVGGVIHHVPPEDLEQVCDCIVRTLAPGSRALITMRAGTGGKRLGLMRWAHDLDQFSQIFEKAGFVTSVVSDPVPPVTDEGTENVVVIVEPVERSATM